VPVVNIHTRPLQLDIVPPLTHLLSKIFMCKTVSQTIMSVQVIVLKATFANEHSYTTQSIINNLKYLCGKHIIRNKTLFRHLVLMATFYKSKLLAGII